MVEEGFLHKDTLKIFTIKTGDRESDPIQPYQHQSKAIKTILQKQKNTIISTGTGSGKSFCFGIPIINTCLEMKNQGIEDPEKLSKKR